jgi:hypothetical protein
MAIDFMQANSPAIQQLHDRGRAVTAYQLAYRLARRHQFRFT